MSADMDDDTLGDPGPSGQAAPASSSRSRSRSRPIERPPDKSPDKSPAPSASRASPSSSQHSRRSMSRDSVHSRSSSGGSEGTDQSDDEEDSEDEYERIRLENMRKNNSLMAELNLKGASSLFASQSGEPTPTPRRRQPKVRRVKRDRNGYIITLPEKGKTHKLACIEIPPDRRIQRLISEGAYKDCLHLGAGEARRWRFGDGTGVLAEGEEPGEVDGVSDTFRWREWDEYSSEEDSIASPKADLPTPEPREKRPKVHYSCKRKSEKAKMRCRNPGCDREYCSTCCARYDFAFDEDNRSWICPYCLNNCNCGACRKKRGLEPLGSSAFGRTPARVEADRQGVKLQTFLEKSEAPRKPAFDRIRLVDMATDVISPPLPRSWQKYLEDKDKPKVMVHLKKRKLNGEAAGSGGKGKGGKGTGGKGKGGKGMGGKGMSKGKGGKGKGKEKDANSAQPEAGDPDAADDTLPPAEGAPKTPPPGPPRILLRIPRPPRKEVDSDGETVHGYSDEEGVPPPSNRQLRRSRSTSTNASESFPSRGLNGAPSTNEFLARQFGFGAVGVPSEPESEHMSSDLFPPHEPETFAELGLLGTGADVTLAVPPLSAVEADSQELALNTRASPHTERDRRTPNTPGGMLARLGLLAEPHPDMGALYTPYQFQMQGSQGSPQANGRNANGNGTHEFGPRLEPERSDRAQYSLETHADNPRSVFHYDPQPEYPPSYFSPPKHASPRKKPPPSAHIVRQPKYLRQGFPDNHDTTSLSNSHTSSSHAPAEPSKEKAHPAPLPPWWA